MILNKMSTGIGFTKNTLLQMHDGTCKKNYYIIDTAKNRLLLDDFTVVHK